MNIQGGPNIIRNKNMNIQGDPNFIPYKNMNMQGGPNLIYYKNKQVQCAHKSHKQSYLVIYIFKF